MKQTLCLYGIVLEHSEKNAFRNGFRTLGIWADKHLVTVHLLHIGCEYSG